MRIASLANIMIFLTLIDVTNVDVIVAAKIFDHKVHQGFIAFYIRLAFIFKIIVLFGLVLDVNQILFEF